MLIIKLGFIGIKTAAIKPAGIEADGFTDPDWHQVVTLTPTGSDASFVRKYQSLSKQGRLCLTTSASLRSSIAVRRPNLIGWRRDRGIVDTAAKRHCRTDFCRTAIMTGSYRPRRMRGV